MTIYLIIGTLPEPIFLIKIFSLHPATINCQGIFKGGMLLFPHLTMLRQDKASKKNV